MRMGRIGDGDVHAAYVEFRAKESDKVPPLPFTHPRPHPLPSPSLTSIQSHHYYSVCRRNVSIANLSERKTPLANASTCSNVPTTLVQ